MLTSKQRTPAGAAASEACAAPDSSAATRDRILEAAVAILESAGEAGVKIREVAALAGAAPTSIYYFFRSREGLLEEALLEAYRRTLFAPFVLLSGRVAQCRGREDLRQAFLDLIAFNTGEDGVLRRRQRKAVLGSAQMRPALHKRIVEVHRQQNATFASLYRDAQAKGWLRKDVDLEAAMGWFIGLVSSRVILEMDPDIGSQAEEWDRITREAVFAVAFGEAPAVKSEEN